MEVRCEQRLEEAIDASRSELEEHDGAIDQAIHDLKRRFVEATDEQSDLVKRLRLGLETIAENDGVLADRVITNISNMHRARREGHKALHHLRTSFCDFDRHFYMRLNGAFLIYSERTSDSGSYALRQFTSHDTGNYPTFPYDCRKTWTLGDSKQHFWECLKCNGCDLGDRY